MIRGLCWEPCPVLVKSRCSGEHLESTTKTGGRKPPELAGRRPALRSAAVPAASSWSFPAPRSLAMPATDGGCYQDAPVAGLPGLPGTLLLASTSVPVSSTALDFQIRI